MEALKLVQVAKVRFENGKHQYKLCQVGFLDVSRDLRNGEKVCKASQVGESCSSTTSNFYRKCRLSNATKEASLAKADSKKLEFLPVSEKAQLWLKGGFRLVRVVVKSSLHPFFRLILLSSKDQHVLKELVSKGDKFLFIAPKASYRFFD